MEYRLRKELAIKLSGLVFPTQQKLHSGQGPSIPKASRAESWDGEVLTSEGTAADT
jgi:hypothetical protein